MRKSSRRKPPYNVTITKYLTYTSSDSDQSIASGDKDKRLLTNVGKPTPKPRGASQFLTVFPSYLDTIQELSEESTFASIRNSSNTNDSTKSKIEMSNSDKTLSKDSDRGHGETEKTFPTTIQSVTDSSRESLSGVTSRHISGNSSSHIPVARPRDDEAEVPFNSTHTKSDSSISSFSSTEELQPIMTSTPRPIGKPVDGRCIIMSSPNSKVFQPITSEATDTNEKELPQEKIYTHESANVHDVDKVSDNDRIDSPISKQTVTEHSDHAGSQEQSVSQIQTSGELFDQLRGEKEQSYSDLKAKTIKNMKKTSIEKVNDDTDDKNMKKTSVKKANDDNDDNDRALGLKDSLQLYSNTALMSPLYYLRMKHKKSVSSEKINVNDDDAGEKSTQSANTQVNDKTADAEVSSKNESTNDKLSDNDQRESSSVSVSQASSSDMQKSDDHDVHLENTREADIKTTQSATNEMSSDSSAVKPHISQTKESSSAPTVQGKKNSLASISKSDVKKPKLKRQMHSKSKGVSEMLSLALFNSVVKSNDSLTSENDSKHELDSDTKEDEKQKALADSKNSTDIQEECRKTTEEHQDSSVQKYETDSKLIEKTSGPKSHLTKFDNQISSASLSAQEEEKSAAAQTSSISPALGDHGEKYNLPHTDSINLPRVRSSIEGRNSPLSQSCYRMKVQLTTEEAETKDRSVAENSKMAVDKEITDFSSPSATEKSEKVLQGENETNKQSELDCSRYFPAQSVESLPDQKLLEKMIQDILTSRSLDTVVEQSLTRLKKEGRIGSNENDNESLSSIKSKESAKTLSERKMFNARQAAEMRKHLSDMAFDYTSPSNLSRKSVDRENMGQSSLSCDLSDDTSLSQLLKMYSELKNVDDKDREESHSTSPGYGHFDIKSASQLLKMYTELKTAECEGIKSNENEGQYSTSPGYGNFDYTTPSKLLTKVEDREKAEMSSPGYGQFSFTSPSQLLRMYSELKAAESDQSKNVTQEIQKDEGKEQYTSPGYGHFDYTTPSKLLSKLNDREMAEMLKAAESEKSIQDVTQGIKKDQGKEQCTSPGYGNFDYTTPSKLLTKVKDREKTEMSSPGYGQFSFTSPSQLLKIYSELKAAESENSKRNLTQEIQKDDGKEQDSSPGYGHFDYTTPSKLLSKVHDKEKSEMSSPGYGQFSFTSPSQLLKMYSELKAAESEKSKQDVTQGIKKEEKDEGNTKYTSPGYGTFDYTTPSKLLSNVIDREKTEMSSPGYGQFSFTSPSQLLKIYSELKAAENEKSKQNVTREIQKDEAKEQYSSPGYGTFDYTTPSKLLSKVNDRERVEMSSPGYEQFSFTSPSQLLKMYSELKAAEKDKSESEVHGMKADKGKVDSSPGYGQFDYTTPSQLLKLSDELKTLYKESSSQRADSAHSLNSDKGSQKQTSSLSELEPGYYFFMDAVLSDLSQKLQSSSLQSVESSPSAGPSTQKSGKKLDFNEDIVGDNTSQGTSQSFIDQQDVGMHTAAFQNSYSFDGKQSKEQESNASLYDISSRKPPSMTNTSKENVDSPTSSQGMKIENRQPVLSDITNYFTNLSQFFLNAAIHSNAMSEPDFIRHFPDLSSESLPEKNSVERMIRDLFHSSSQDLTEQSLTKMRRDSRMHDIESRNIHSDESQKQTPEEEILHASEIDLNLSTSMPTTQSFDTAYDASVSSIGSGLDDKTYLTSSSMEMLQRALKLMQRETLQSLSSICKNIGDTDSKVSQTSKDKHVEGSNVTITYNPSFETFSDESDDELNTTVIHEGADDTEQRSEQLQVLTDKTEEESDSEVRQETKIFPHIVIPSSISKPSDTQTKESYSSVSEVGSLPVLKNNLKVDQVSAPGSRAPPPSVSSMSEQFISDYLLNIQSLKHPSEHAQSTSPTLPVPTTDQLVAFLALTLLEQHAYQQHQHAHHDRTQKSQSLTAGSVSDSRNFALEKEVLESQCRKLQIENNTLQAENKHLKEKYNRATVKVSELEEELHAVQTELDTVQNSLSQELSDARKRSKNENERENEQLKSENLVLTKDNDSLKSEIKQLERNLFQLRENSEQISQISEKNRTLEAYKMEMNSLKEELSNVKSLLYQCEGQLAEEKEHSKQSSAQIMKLTEMKNLLEKQLDTGSNSAVAEKQMVALEKRLKITEDRLHQERGDRANNLSLVEDKLLTENARLQASEKENSRQLNREKEKNKNLDKRVRDLRDENQKLRLSLPFDDTAPLSDSYDIPYGTHSNQRWESKKISGDMKYIMGQIEKQEGLKRGQEREIICELWNKKELALKKVKEYEIQLKKLELDDNLSEGLKNLQEMKDQYETKLQQLEEKYENIRTEKETFEKTYKEQLSTLVKERHEALARLATSNDLLEAIKVENDMLRKGMSSVTTSTPGDIDIPSQDGRMDALTAEVRNLEGKVAQLNRKNQLLNGELDTLRAQLSAREKALEDAQAEMEKSFGKVNREDDEITRKQQKIDQLLSQVSSQQSELKSWSEKLHVANIEKSQLEYQVEDLRRKIKLSEARQESKKIESTAKQLQTMELDLTDKETQIMKTTAHLQCTEMELGKMKQELHSCQEHSADMSSQVESLQNQLGQRTQILDMLNNSENEKICQIQMLKDSLDSVNQKLSAKEARVKILEVELSREEDKAERFQKELTKYRKTPEEDILSQQNHGDAIKNRQMEIERDNLKCEILQLTTSKDALRREMDGLNNEIHDMAQKLNHEKASINCILTEKAELEKQLEIVLEERNALLEEKNQADEDLVKLENKLQDILHKFEVEARRQHENIHSKYTEIPPETRKLFGEIDSLKILVEGKDKEIEMLQDKLNRQQLESNFMNRKMVLLDNEIQCNRDDITRLTGILSLKMRENTATVEMNQYLDAERTKLQKENYQLQKDLDKEKDRTQQNKIEIDEIVRKIQNTEFLHKNKETELNKKDIYLCELETHLRQAEKNVAYLENENKESASQMKSLSDEVQSLSSVNSKLETKIQALKHELDEEKTNARTQQDELTTCRQKLEILKHENTLVFNSLNSEKQNLDKMKESLQSSEESSSKLKDQISSLQCELQSQKREVNEWKEKVDHLMREKSGVYTEYTDVCRKLNEKDQALLLAGEKLNKDLEKVEKNFARERKQLEDEKASLTRDIAIAREERKELKEKIRQKDLQLNNFGRTLQDLEDMSREKKNLEMKVEKLESSHGDSKVLLESHRSEVMSLKEANRQTQETYQKLQVSNYTLQEELRSHKDLSRIEISDLKHRLEDAQKHNETEKSSLREILNKTQSCLQTAEHDLSKMKEARDELMNANKSLEKSLDESKSKLNEEIIGRKLAEQKIETVNTQMNETKKKMEESQYRYTELQNILPKLESDLKIEMERTRKLSEENKTLESATFVHESNASNKKEQVDVLQTEMSKLRLIIENQKQQMNVRLKKTTGDMKQQMDIVEEDRNRLNQQFIQVKTDLEKSRDLLAEKNKENLKLQEHILSLENEVREGNSKIRMVQDSLRMEEEMQMKMSYRHQEQEDELKRLKTFMSKKAEQSGDGEKSLWLEMNKVIQDLSMKMSKHMESQKSSDKESQDREAEKVVKYKKQIAQLETDLHTEKALHNITKGSVQALEEDCQRLRIYLRSSRKKDNTSEKKTKSRMEEINERIAKAQARAQAVISSGMFNADLSGAYNLTSHDPGNLSPDDSVASDSSFMGIPPLNVSFQAPLPRTFQPSAVSPKRN